LKRCRREKIENAENGEREMKFKGNYIAISKNPSGCEIIIKEDKNDKDIYNPGNYLLFQKAYAEDDGDENCVYLETNDSAVGGFIKNAVVTLKNKNLTIEFEKKKIEIELNCSEKEYKE
jgi:hypothetical protein